jgi:GntR family transcriptional regulator/MocR family aminotransferase
LLGKGAFSIGQPAFEYFPVHIWSRLVARYGRSLKTTSLQYGYPAGRMELREAIASYLRSSRAVHCEAEQILVVSGSQQALHIAALALLDPGDRVWLEEPGYWLARRVFDLTQARIVPVPVDDEGMDVAEGIRLFRKAKLAFVTPSHQFPLGATMSLARRLQLLEWAQKNGSWIVEDDYDAEYRYESRPIASLQGLDAEKRVIYIGTFSKVLFPSLRTGYMVVPPDLFDRFLAVRQTIDVTQSDLNQAILAEFIREGHFVRHIRRMRTLYGERRAVLAENIQKYFGTQLEVHGAESGMHLSVTLPKGFRDRELSMKAAAHELWLWPLSSMYLGRNPRHGWMLGFGGVGEKEIPRAVRSMYQVINGDA